MRRRNERGTTAVELAIVLPVLLLIIFSVVDFGRYIYTNISLSSASFEVADAITRGLFLSNDTNNSKTEKMKLVTQDIAPGIASFAQLDSNGQLDFNPLPTACPNPSGKTVVSITSTFKPLSPVIDFFDQAMSTTSMRCLR